MKKDLKAIIFNAPPRTGKDVASEHLIKILNEKQPNVAHHRTFKHGLIKLCASLYGMTVEEFLEGYDAKSPFSETGWHKDNMCMGIASKEDRHGDLVFKRYSQRSSLIHISENVIKPVFGKDAFGKALVESLPEEGIVVISDCGGFVDEIKPVVENIKQENVLFIRIHREDMDFSDDSRSYFDVSKINDKIEVFDVDNNGTLEDFIENVENIVKNWLKI